MSEVRRCRPPRRREALCRLPAEPGTYVLVLQVKARAVVEVGSLGPVVIDRGFCLYVGSALGSGGLRARLARHLCGGERSHWHIDRLRTIATPVEIWLCVGDCRREHAWARLLASSRGCAMPRARFGASDCRCPGHLFASRRRPSLRWFRRLLGEHHPPVRSIGVSEEGVAAGRSLPRSEAPRVESRRAGPTTL